MLFNKDAHGLILSNMLVFSVSQANAHIITNKEE